VRMWSQGANRRSDNSSAAYLREGEPMRDNLSLHLCGAETSFCCCHIHGLVVIDIVVHVLLLLLLLFLFLLLLLLLLLSEGRMSGRRLQPFLSGAGRGKSPCWSQQGPLNGALIVRTGSTKATPLAIFIRLDSLRRDAPQSSTSLCT